MRQNGIILLPVDLSDACVPALRFACAMARCYDARVELVHVVNEAPAIWKLGWPQRFGESAPTVNEAERAFDEWLDEHGPLGIRFERRVVVGAPGFVIAREAKKLPADFLVLATHGNMGLQARFVGGIANQVLRVVRCPVASIKPPGFGETLLRMWEGIKLFGNREDAVQGVKRTSSFPPRKIIHPTDFSEASHHATQLAARMAKHAGAELNVLHVAPKEDLSASRIDRAEKMDEICLQVEAMGGICPKLKTVQGDAASEIIRESASQSADLIVMGSEGIGGLSVLSVGSTAAKVVRHASCPVITLRADTSLAKIDRKFRKVYESLSVATLRSFDEEKSLSLEDLVGESEPEHFLGFYTPKGFTHALEQYGMLKALRNRGFEDLNTTFDLSDPYEHTFRVHFGGQEDREHLLIEATLKPSVIALPKTDSGEEGGRHPVLVASWLCMQNPLGSFSPCQAPMPNQQFPGLGLGREMLELLLLIAERLGKSALVNHPMHLHNACYYHHNFRFLDPRVEGRLTAILRDTSDASLADASWALQLGCLMGPEPGVALRWKGREQVFPMSDELKAYFESPAYRRQVWATAAEEKYEIDWDQFRAKASGSPLPTSRARSNSW